MRSRVRTRARSRSSGNAVPTKYISKGHRTLMFVIMGLIAFGTIMIYSGSVPIAAIQEVAPYFYFVKQLQSLIFGIIAFVITYNIDYHKYPKLAIPGIIFTIFLLILVLFTPEINNAHRWLDLKFMTLQVSDLAKVTVIIYLASLFSKPFTIASNEDKYVAYFVRNLLPFLLILGAISFLIILQPNLSTTALIGIIALTIYFLSGEDNLHTLGTFSIGIVLGLAGLGAGIIAPYRFARITTYMQFFFSGNLTDPYGSDYHLRQILIAVGTGGLTGEGFAQSKQKFSYLTDTAFSDTIFAIFAEEFGFLGSIVLVGVFVWIMFQGFTIAKKAPDKLGSLLAAGITVWFTVQAFIHFSVNVGLIPLTGVPLPFMSFGGSSLLMLMAGTGILMNVSRFIDWEDGTTTRLSRIEN